MGWLRWLNANSGAVTAVVTAVYAVFTILLWWATRRQAMLTQRAFEASHRPYLSLRVLKEDTDWADRDAVRLDVAIENVGAVPAEVTKWEVFASLMDMDGAQQPIEQEQVEGLRQRTRETLLGACLFPGREHPVRLEFRHAGVFGTPLPLRVMVTVEYRGGAGTIYRTTLEAERTPSTHWQRARAT